MPEPSPAEGAGEGGSRFDHLVVRRTPLVRVRLAHPDDALDEYRWRRDPELARLHGREVLEEPYHVFAERFRQALAFRDPSGELFALDDASGRHVGSIMYYGASATGQTAEMGISIGAKEQRGRGLGTHATVAFLRHLWDATPLRTVTLRTLASNAAAQACFSRAGFQVTERDERMVYMSVAREWWTWWELDGRFAFVADLPLRTDAP